MSLKQHLPRRPLAFLPTPLHPLRNLSSLLPGSHRLWIKRDDQTGLAGGGNKTRKLEFLVADALAAGADTLITTGAVQSNHCRQTAAAASASGLRCHLVLGGQPPSVANGNLLLDQLLGAELHWTARENRLSRLRELEHELREQGRRPYLITYGGSDPVGACGYAFALEELLMQARDAGIGFDAILFASSSGGTQAGLAAGAWLLGWDVPVIGISVDEAADDLCAKVADLATRTVARLGGEHAFSPREIHVNADYLGGGYGILGGLEREAIALAARTEGVLVDPVYTARALGGLLDLFRRGELASAREILFWHTGGATALFAYAEQLG